MSAKMPPKRRRESNSGTESQAQLSEPESKKWRLCSGQAFPRIPGGDITISLIDRSEDDLVLCHQDLSRMCDYFRDLEGTTVPQHFRLAPSADPAACRVVQVCSGTMTGSSNSGDLGSRAQSQGTGEEEDALDNKQSVPVTNEDLTIYARQLNEILFRFLYRQDVYYKDFGVNVIFPKLMLDITKLAASYGCSDCIKSEILLTLCRTSEQGGDWCQRQPFLVLEITASLKDERTFSAALRHAVGQRAAYGVSIESLPETLAGIVQSEADLMGQRIEHTSLALALPSQELVDLQSFIAWGLFNQHLISHTLSKPAASVERCRELFYIINMRSGMDLITGRQAKGILQSVGNVDDGLVQGNSFTEWLDDDDRSENAAALCALDAAIEEKLNVNSVCAALKGIFERSKRVLEPLFSGDRNVEYFTCVSSKRVVPWKQD